MIGRDAVLLRTSLPESVAELQVSARLHAIHPNAIRFSTGFEIAPYALCRVEAPVLTKTLGFAPYVKIFSKSTAPVDAN